MLLETKSVTGFALLFGTTWVVNAIVFAGVLVAVLAAVEVTRRFRTPPLPVMYAVLFGGLVLAWLVPDALAAVAAAAAAGGGRGAGRVPADLRRERDLRQALHRHRRRHRRPSAPTCSARCSAAAWSTLALIIGFDGLLIIAALLYVGAFLLTPKIRAVVRS